MKFTFKEKVLEQKGKELLLSESAYKSLFGELQESYNWGAGCTYSFVRENLLKLLKDIKFEIQTDNKREIFQQIHRTEGEKLFIVSSSNNGTYSKQLKLDSDNLYILGDYLLLLFNSFGIEVKEDVRGYLSKDNLILLNLFCFGEFSTGLLFSAYKYFGALNGFPSYGMVYLMSILLDFHRETIKNLYNPSTSFPGYNKLFLVTFVVSPFVNYPESFELDNYRIAKSLNKNVF